MTELSNQNILTDQELRGFNALTNFISALVEIFEKSNKPLALYNRLVEKTTFKHISSIKKHITAFTDFFNSNKDYILKKTINNDSSFKISYSDRIYIDVKYCLNNADKEMEKTIWTHILVIGAILNLSNDAKNIVKNDQENTNELLETLNIDTSSNEGKFLGNMFDKIQGAIDFDSIDCNNPIEAVMNIMKTGFIEDLASDIGKEAKNGSIDLGNLLNSVQGVLTPENNSDISNIMSQMAQGGEGSSGTPNPLSMIGNLSGMLSGESDDGPSKNSPEEIERVINDKLKLESKKNEGE